MDDHRPADAARARVDGAAQSGSRRAQRLKDTVGWGLALWAIGYALGMMLFAIVPVSLIGWVIMPIGTALTLWVGIRRVQGDTMRAFCIVGLAWTAIAVLGDYLFIVKALKPAEGYYKLDVYLYYALTLAIPLFAGWRRTRGHPQRV